jgi:hypothetical protein
MSINYYPPNGFDGSNSVQSLPFYLAVQQGKVPGYSMINKFGYNPAIGSGSFETIWETGDDYPYQSSAVTLDVVSDDSNDDVAGTGARTLRIQGLDGSYNFAEETVNMDGTTTVTTTQTFLRVFRMSVETVGSSGNNEGDITVTYTGGSDVAATITVGNGQTLMALYTIPAGYTGYLLSLNVSSGKDQEMLFKIITRDNNIPDTGFQIKQFLDVRGGLTFIDFADGGAYGEKTDIQVDAKASSTSSAAASFDLLLVQDGY